MMETVEFNSTPTTPQKGDNPANEGLQEDVANITKDDVIVSEVPGSDVPNGTLKGDDQFLDPGQTDPNAPPPAEGQTAADADSITKKLLDLKVTKTLFSTYDKLRLPGAPDIEKIGNNLNEVHEKWKGEGIVAAAKTATTMSLEHTKDMTTQTFAKSKEVADSTWKSVAETTTNITNKSYEKTKPYLQRVVENPQVDRVVGTVRSASVGAGSMATTIAASVTEVSKERLGVAKETMDHLRGYTPEYAAKQASEEEAWKQVLCGGNGGEELKVPARQELTSSFFVKAGSVLTWRFRVQAMDVGFAVRLRVQGDGGSSEVDVFAMQKYSAGVTVQGEWSPVTDSSLVIVWDNSYSYLREKCVAFQACVKKMEDHLADQARFEKEEKEKQAKAEEEAKAKQTDVSQSSTETPAVEPVKPASREDILARFGAKPAGAPKPITTTEESTTTPAVETVVEEKGEVKTTETVAAEENHETIKEASKIEEPVESNDPQMEEKEKDADY